MIRKIYSKLKIIILYIFCPNIKISIHCGDICGLKIISTKESSIILSDGSGCRAGVIFNVNQKGIIKIGKNSFLNYNCILNAKENITIGENTIIGQNVLMYDHDHDYKNINNMRDNFIIEKITIGNNVWIGSNVTILRGSAIGDGCVVGAGTVIKGKIPNNTMVYHEKKLVKKRLECGCDCV